MVQKQPVNPFYVALLPVGVVFVVSACAYGVMMVRDLGPQHDPPTGLMGLMDRHGLAILVSELAVLAMLTMLAIGTDDFWARWPNAR